MITYQYDNANRMAKAGGVNYTWDNNGNLINDGSATYLNPAKSAGPTAIAPIG